MALHLRLIGLRQRLDSLRAGEIRAPRLLDRAAAFFLREGPVPPLEKLPALDRELDQVGIHTGEDARLLRALEVQQGRAGALAVGLARRAEEVLAEFEDRVGRLERALLNGDTPGGVLTALDDGFVRLARVVKVAGLFGESAPSLTALAPFELYERPAPAALPPPRSARVAVAQHWAARARANTGDVLQKRRDLDAAHELLLRIGSTLDRELTHGLRIEVAQARERVRAVPAVRSLTELLRHARHAARSDPRAVYRSLRGLYDRAVEAGDAPLAEAAITALKPLLADGPALRERIERREDDERAAWLGTPSPAVPGLGASAPGADDRLANLAFDLDAETLAAFELAAGCARYFDVEDALGEEVDGPELSARRPVPRRVPYPTQTLTFETTGGLHEVQDFVISDPRMLLYDLASNRQTVRAYLDEAPPEQPAKRRRTAVRVYVCDASASMHGARARFRDAILIAELNNLRLRSHRGERVDPLYYCFFNDTPSELVRVDSASEALRQIQRLFAHSPAEGQTQITTALLAAFDSIRAAKGHDPYLARATVVLVTDGEDRVEVDVLRRARAPVDSVDIALSFISLGEENPDLKALILDQRLAGRRAFYHHLSDREIGVARSEFDSRWRTLLPPELPLTPAALESLLPQLEALEALAEGRPAGTPARPDVGFDAVFPAELPPKAVAPPPKETLERLADILGAISEAGALCPADQRGSESVLLLQHLLGVYGLTVPRYLGALAHADAIVSESLARVRLVCRPYA